MLDQKDLRVLLDVVTPKKSGNASTYLLNLMNSARRVTLKGDGLLSWREALSPPQLPEAERQQRPMNPPQLPEAERHRHFKPTPASQP
jgi:hypothetical protein